MNRIIERMFHMGRTRRIGVGVFIFAALVMVLVASSPNWAVAQPIKIGALLSMTGPFVDPGKDFRNAIELKLDEVGWKVAGKPIELIVEDDKSFDSATGMDKTKKMVEGDKIHLLIGPLLGGIRLAVEPYLDRAKVPNICLSRHLIKAAKDLKWNFMPAGILREYSRPLGWFAYEELGLRKANTISDDHLAGREYMAGVIDGFQEKGGKVLLQQYPPAPTPDYASYITAFNKDADVAITFLGGRGTLDFIKTFIDFGLKDKMKILIVTNGEFLKEEHFPSYGDEILGIAGLTDYNWRIDNPANKKFVKAYEAKTGKKPSPFSSRGYDAISIAIAALQATKGDTTPETLRKALQEVKLQTPSGPLSFTPLRIGIRDMFGVVVQKIDGKTTWGVVKTYRQFSAD